MSEGENEVHESSGSVWRDLNLPEPIYTVEAHGNGYAIYFGRSASRHGYNLARLSDIAANGRDLPKLIEAGLNAADTITSLTTQLEAERERATKAEAALREKAMEYLALDQQATEALARAVKAEEERDRLRTVLLEAREDIRTYVSSRWSEFEDTPDSAVAYIDAALKTGEPTHD